MVTFVDQVTLHLRAGNGGDGCVSVHREKFKPLAGPDGADGGNGGSISLIADPNTTTLLEYHFHPHRSGGDGGDGAGDFRNGATGADVKLPVPIGTTLFITARIVGQQGRKVYSVAEGRINAPDGPLAVRAASLFIIVPMKHFLENAPAEYIAAIKANPELLSFIDPEFNINP